MSQSISLLSSGAAMMLTNVVRAPALALSFDDIGLGVALALLFFICAMVAANWGASLAGNFRDELIGGVGRDLVGNILPDLRGAGRRRRGGENREDGSRESGAAEKRRNSVHGWTLLVACLRNGGREPWASRQPATK